MCGPSEFETEVIGHNHCCFSGLKDLWCSQEFETPLVGRNGLDPFVSKRPVVLARV